MHAGLYWLLHPLWKCILLPDGMAPLCSANSQDGGVFYRKQLTLKHPSSACEVKVISRSPCLRASIPSFLFSHWPFRRCPSCCLWLDAATSCCAEWLSGCGRRRPVRRAAPQSTCSRCKVWWKRWEPVCRQELRTWWTWSVCSSWWVEMPAFSFHYSSCSTSSHLLLSTR